MRMSLRTSAPLGESSKTLLPYARIAIVATAMMGLPAQAYEVSLVSGGGSVEGTVVYRGEVPMKKIIPTKDRDVCGGAREEPRIKVGANQEVESAVVYLVDVKAGKAWPEQSAPPKLPVFLDRRRQPEPLSEAA
jgi:hypothetical protein